MTTNSLAWAVRTAMVGVAAVVAFLLVQTDLPLDPIVKVALGALQVFLADVERRRAPAREEPLVGIGADEIHTEIAEVRRKRSERLDAVDEQQPAVAVRQIRKGLDIVLVAVAVRHPGHRDQPRPLVGARGELLERRPAALVRHDPELDAAQLLELPVEHRAGVAGEGVAIRIEDPADHPGSRKGLALPGNLGVG